MKKNFKLKAEDIKKLVSPMGGCIATDTITVDGLLVQYMDNSNNMGIYDVNTIANYDPAIIPYLNKPHGTSWQRVEGTDEFVEIEQPDFE